MIIPIDHTELEFSTPYELEVFAVQTQAERTLFLRKRWQIDLKKILLRHPAIFSVEKGRILCGCMRTDH